MKDKIKKYDDYYYLTSKIITWAGLIVISVILHFVILLYFTKISNIENITDFISIIRYFFIGLSYLIPIIIAKAAFEISWHLYEEFPESKQLTWCKLSILFVIGLIVIADKLLFNIF